MSREPRIDAYIAKAQPFARPILEKVRERVHAVVNRRAIDEAHEQQHLLGAGGAFPGGSRAGADGAGTGERRAVGAHRAPPTSES